jgi:hypothetical protein
MSSEYTVEQKIVMTNNTYISEVLPVKGEDMKTIFLPNGRTLIRHDYRKGRTPTHAQITVPSQKTADIVIAKYELLKRCEVQLSKSSGIMFETLVDAVVKKNNGAGMPWVYNAIRQRFSGCPVNASFVHEFQAYIANMEDDDRSLNTIANHKSAIQRTLNYAYQRGIIDVIPIRTYDITRSFRDRVWSTDEERLRFFNTLRGNCSHLYWSMVLLERRPIRAHSDLWRLTNENLVLIGPGAPYLRYRAKKTGNRVSRDTHIPLHGLDDVIDYLRFGRPTHCPLLFPRLEGPIRDVGNFNDWQQCAWYPMGKPKRHFTTMCERADIVDLHIHDFKHIAMTSMIDEGYSIEKIMALGIQFDERMIRNVYWHKNATKVLESLSASSNDCSRREVL